MPKDDFYICLFDDTTMNYTKDLDTLSNFLFVCYLDDFFFKQVDIL